MIVHQIEKGKCVPSLSHFVVKLETYLRMANIPYEVGHSKQVKFHCDVRAFLGSLQLDLLSTDNVSFTKIICHRNL